MSIKFNPCRSLKKICPASFREICQWLKFSLNRLRTHSRVSPVVGLLPLASGPACLTLMLLMWRIGRARNSIPIYEYKPQDSTLHSLFISVNCFTCFGWYFHPSSGLHTPVSTASGICHTVTAICSYRGRVGTGLSVLWVAYAYGVTNTRCCRYSCMSSWWWVGVPLETDRAVSRYK
jgi:hypothetical protein